MFHLILYQPEIPPNTGNIIRLCANVGATLHLVHPLGFSMDAKQLRRAGLDYREYADVREHASFEECQGVLHGTRMFALTTRGRRSLFSATFCDGDAFVLGPETRGLPRELLAGFPANQIVRLPMRPENRSLNLANTAAVVLYEAWRQLGFEGGV